MKTYQFWALQHESGFYLCAQRFLDQREGWGRYQMVLSTYANAMRFQSDMDAWFFLVEEQGRQYLKGLEVAQVTYSEGQ